MTGPSPTASSGDAMCLEMFNTARGMMVCRRVEDHPDISEDGIGHSVSSLDLPGYHNEKVAFQVKARIEEERERVFGMVAAHIIKDGQVTLDSLRGMLEELNAPEKSSV